MLHCCHLPTMTKKLNRRRRNTKRLGCACRIQDPPKNRKSTQAASLQTCGKNLKELQNSLKSWTHSSYFPAWYAEQTLMIGCSPFPIPPGKWRKKYRGQVLSSFLSPTNNWSRLRTEAIGEMCAKHKRRLSRQTARRTRSVNLKKKTAEIRKRFESVKNRNYSEKLRLKNRGWKSQLKIASEIPLRNRQHVSWAKCCRKCSKG